MSLHKNISNQFFNFPEMRRNFVKAPLSTIEIVSKMTV